MNNMPYGYNPNIIPMMPYTSEVNIYEQKINTLESRINALENKISNIEKKLNITSNETYNPYKSSMHMM